MKRLVKAFAIICFFVIATIMGLTLYLSWTIPDKFSVVDGDVLSINSKFDLSITKNKTSKMVNVSSGSDKKVALDKSIMLWGIIPIKQVSVSLVKESYVIPGGQPFGIKMFTQGVMVVGMSDIDTSDGPKNPAKEAGIKTGDIINEINNIKVNTNEDVAQVVLDSKGKKLSILASRKNITYQTSITPVKLKAENNYRIGIWVRDSSAGVGTITYYCPMSGVFGGLGHAVTDVDTGEIMPLMSGEVAKVDIRGITKGQKGTPGELKGAFVGDNSMGSLLLNLETGMFGKLSVPIIGEAIPIAMKQEIKEDYATIRCTLNGDTPKEYKILIEKVNYNSDTPTKNLIIKIVDEELLSLTGGIVQGMSGSPIIQNGKLVGAVTHVLVNDPQRGFGIFAENMQKQSAELEKTKNKPAA